MELGNIKVITNIGAGTMGHATALQFAMNGYDVNLLDNNDEALDRSVEAVKHDLQTFKDADFLKDDPATILGRIHVTTDYEEALKSADFVIESIVEDPNVKKEVWQNVERFVSDETILATNTSGLSPSEIQAVLKTPTRFVVAHFWNPAQLMPLVEVVPGVKTTQDTVDLTVELMNRIGKHAVPLKKEALGFVGNRIQAAVLREALHVISNNIASPEAVDDIIKYSLGRRWSLVGPVASADLGGLDVFDSISAYLYADLAVEKGADPLLEKMVKEKKLGLKTGQGFYDWTGEAGLELVKQRDAELLKLLKKDEFNAQ